MFTLSSDDAHAKVLPTCAPPLASLATACNCTVAPIDVNVDDPDAVTSTDTAGHSGPEQALGPVPPSPPHEVIMSDADMVSVASGQRSL